MDRFRWFVEFRGQSGVPVWANPNAVEYVKPMDGGGPGAVIVMGRRELHVQDSPADVALRLSCGPCPLADWDRMLAERVAAGTTEPEK